MTDHIRIDPGERILLKVRKHWIILVRDTIGTLVIGAIPFLLVSALIVVGPFPNAFVVLPPPILTFVESLWILVVWITLAVIWTNYYLDLWIVTDRRIFNINQIGLFNREVATWSLDNVQEISVRVQNPIQALFGYGTIQIETAGPRDEYARAEGIPNPEKVRTVILTQLGRIDKLEATTKKQEGLLHMIGHEVKGYLTKNAAALASIAEGDYGTVPPPLKSVANSALSETRKGVSTVMNILGSSSARDGTVTLEKATMDVRALARELVDSHREAAEKKGLAFDLTLADEPCTIEGDATKLREIVFRNLLDNAIRYTPAGSVRVAVARFGERVVFSVKDTGIGISREDMTKLFTEGGKGSRSSALNPESTGYGLFIAKSVVEAHGGRIWAESEGPSKGSQFFVELPIAA